MVTPDACAGTAALLGRVPRARTAHCDVPEEWTVTSLSDAF